jgi:hypothetical protein
MIYFLLVTKEISFRLTPMPVTGTTNDEIPLS